SCILSMSSSFLSIRRPPCPPLFPYTTLFRSVAHVRLDGVAEGVAQVQGGANARLALVGADHARLGGAGALDGLAQRGVIQPAQRSEEHTSELQSRENLVCRLLLEKKKANQRT